MSYPKPLPVLDVETRPFWEACQSGRLMLQRCTDCGHIRFPPTRFCARCRSVKCEWIESKGHGRVFSWIVVRHPVPREVCVEFVAGSHLWGRWFRPRKFTGIAYDHKDDGLEDMPDISARRGDYRLLSWDLEPGDAGECHIEHLRQPIRIAVTHQDSSAWIKQRSDLGGIIGQSAYDACQFIGMSERRQRRKDFHFRTRFRHDQCATGQRLIDSRVERDRWNSLTVEMVCLAKDIHNDSGAAVERMSASMSLLHSSRSNRWSRPSSLR